MRVLVIGYGSMGKRHAFCARDLGHDVTVYDVRPIDAALVRSDIALADNLDAALATDPDAVVIATPARTHVAILIDALHRTTAAVYVEKPLAMYSIATASWYADDPMRHRRRGVVGYNLRFHDGYRWLKDHLEDAVGTPTTARFVVQCDQSTWPGLNYADMLLEASHEIDLALWIFGPAVVAGAVNHAGKGDCWTVLLEHDCGVVSTIVLDGTHSGYRRIADISGPIGVRTLRWNNDLDLFGWQWRGRNMNSERDSSGVVTPNQMYRAALSAFLAGDDSGAATFDDGNAVLMICDAARAIAKRTLNEIWLT